jgi:hypothetical protein
VSIPPAELGGPGWTRIACRCPCPKGSGSGPVREIVDTPCGLLPRVLYVRFTGIATPYPVDPNETFENDVTYVVQWNGFEWVEYYPEGGRCETALLPVRTSGGNTWYRELCVGCAGESMGVIACSISGGGSVNVPAVFCGSVNSCSLAFRPSVPGVGLYEWSGTVCGVTIDIWG